MIRPLKETDLPAVFAIEQLTQVAPWSLSAFERCIETGYPSWVVEFAGQTVGFIIVSTAVSECHILNLSVHPERQRKGLGKQLLEHVLAWARTQGITIVYLEVRRSNLVAINLYSKMSFKVIGERKDYYVGIKGSEDALILARDLGVT